MKKAGIVALIGRPNVGKSTLLNNLLGQKVSITSPKPQTTRFAIEALYEDERGQIIFIDTPGMFAQSDDPLSKIINERTFKTASSDIDLVLYIIDVTKQRNTEENKTLGLVRKINVPKILVVNKSDLSPKYSADYAFYKNEFPEMLKVSAFTKSNLNYLLEAIFAKLPEREPLVNSRNMVQPGLNIDSKLFISEIIREKVFLFSFDELPYTVNTQVEQILERSNSTLYIKGKIITTDDRYKKMLIGKNGKMIKEIGMAVRKELETATNKKIFIDLQVEVDPHWQSNY